MSDQLHIVDELIQERAAHLMQYPRLWKIIKRALYPLLNYRQSLAMIDAVQGMTGSEILNFVSNKLQLTLDAQGLEHIPTSGGAVVMANHPSGIADGVALWDALSSKRQDIVFFANRDAIRAAPGLADTIIPVEWVEEKRTRERSKETVKQMVSAFRAQRLIVIFPSGRLAQPTLSGLQERPWMPTAVSLAQKYQVPVVPVHLVARNSWLFYCLYFINNELRDMTLFRELLNKQGSRYKITVAQSFVPRKDCGDLKPFTESLRQFVVDDIPRGERDFRFPAMVGQPSISNVFGLLITATALNLKRLIGSLQRHRHRRIGCGEVNPNWLTW